MTTPNTGIPRADASLVPPHRKSCPSWSTSFSNGGCFLTWPLPLCGHTSAPSSSQTTRTHSKQVIRLNRFVTRLNRFVTRLNRFVTLDWSLVHFVSPLLLKGISDQRGTRPVVWSKGCGRIHCKRWYTGKPGGLWRAWVPGR